MSVLRTDARGPQPSPPEVIFGLALGYLASRSLHVANELGIADLMKGGLKASRSWLAQREHNNSRSIDCSECWPAMAFSLKSRPDDFD
jgi:hypothetical protein